MCGFECLVFRVLGLGFKCLGFRVRFFQVWFHFWGFEFLYNNIVCVCVEYWSFKSRFVVKIKRHNHGLKIVMKKFVLSSCFCICKMRRLKIRSKKVGLGLKQIGSCRFRFSWHVYNEEIILVDFSLFSFENLKNVFFKLLKWLFFQVMMVLLLPQVMKSS